MKPNKTLDNSPEFTKLNRTRFKTSRLVDWTFKRLRTAATAGRRASIPVIVMGIIFVFSVRVLQTRKHYNANGSAAVIYCNNIVIYGAMHAQETRRTNYRKRKRY